MYFASFLGRRKEITFFYFSFSWSTFNSPLGQPNIEAYGPQPNIEAYGPIIAMHFIFILLLKF